MVSLNFKEISMSMFPNSNVTRKPFELDYGTDEKVVFHFFNAVYAWMCVGLAVTASVAYLVAQNAAAVRSFASLGVMLIFLLVLVVMTSAIQSAAARMRPALATVLFLAVAAIIGAFMSSIFVFYQLQTIAGAFVMTAGVFGGMSVYGFVTKRDLTAMRSIFIMCVWGVILASIVNYFIASSLFYWIINYVILALFIGLTAADTQRLKVIAERTRGDARAAASYAIVGSLQLYLDFINMFMVIVQILGGTGGSRR
jgi:FtsH-binding integral membrane protein